MDWRDSKTMGQCAELYRTQKMLTDVTFVFPNDDDRKCVAHKLILSMRSAVFEAMFFGTMAEVGNEISIEDIEVDTFEQMIGYMYTDSIQLSETSVTSCLYAAKKYCLEGLLQLCLEFLGKSITTENVCSIFECARSFNHFELQDKCLQHIAQHADKVFSRQDFLQLTKEGLEQVFSDEELCVTEVTAFQAACVWSEAACKKKCIEATPENKHEILGPVLEAIRFPVMTAKEFGEIVSPTGILPMSDQIGLFQYLVSSPYHSQERVGKYIAKIRNNFEFILPPFEDVKKCGEASNLEIKLQATQEVLLTGLKFGADLGDIRLQITNFENTIHDSTYSADKRDVFFNFTKTVIPKDKKITITVTPASKFAGAFSHKKVNYSTTCGRLAVHLESVPSVLKGLRFGYVQDAN